MVLVIYMNAVTKRQERGERRPGTIGNAGDAVMAEGLLKKPVINAGNLQIVVEIIAQKCPDNTIRAKVISAVARRMSEVPSIQKLGEIVDNEIEGLKR